QVAAFRDNPVFKDEPGKLNNALKTAADFLGQRLDAGSEWQALATWWSVYAKDLDDTRKAAMHQLIADALTSLLNSPKVKGRKARAPHDDASGHAHSIGIAAVSILLLLDGLAMWLFPNMPGWAKLAHPWIYFFVVYGIGVVVHEIFGHRAIDRDT